MTRGIADISAFESLQQQQNEQFGCGCRNRSCMAVFNQGEQTDEVKISNDDEEDEKTDC